MAKTETISIDKIAANNGQIPGVKANPRLIKDEKYRKLKKSLEDNPEMLELRELLVYEHDGKFNCIGGNMRYRACKELGYKEIPCKVIPSTATAEQLNAYIIKDNAGFGEWDWDMLANEWDADLLDDWGVDVWQEEKEEEKDEAEAKEDDFDEDKEQIESRCKKGDVWQCGEHRLMCGDSTDDASVALLMNGERADITFTSPPYNAGKVENLSGNTHTKGSKYKNSDDNLTDYKKLLVEFTKQAIKSSKFAFVNIQMLAGNKLDFIEYISTFKSHLVDIMIWNKINAAPAMAENVLNSVFEFILIFSSKNNPTRAISTGKFRGNVINVYSENGQHNNEFSEVHAATFPIHLPSHFIKNFTQDNGSVLDLFGGTGTTMMAAEQLGRKCFMMELDPHYCDVILARWEKLTGKEAIKLN